MKKVTGSLPILVFIFLLSSCSSTRKATDKSQSTVHNQTDSAGSKETTNAADFFSNDQSVTLITEKVTSESVTNADSISVEVDTVPTETKHGAITVSTHKVGGKTIVKVHKAPEAVKVPIERTTITKNDIKTTARQLQSSKETVAVKSVADSTGSHKVITKDKKGMSFGVTVGIIFAAFIILLIIAYLIYRKYSNRIKQLL
jgi:hypothetical protein